MDYFCYVTCSCFKCINRAISLYCKKRNHILTEAKNVINTQYKMVFHVDILNAYYKIKCSYMQFVYNLNSPSCRWALYVFCFSRKVRKVALGECAVVY